MVGDNWLRRFGAENARRNLCAEVILLALFFFAGPVAGTSVAAFSLNDKAKSGPGFSQAPGGQPQFPLMIEVIPEKLKVRIWLHEANARSGPFACWSYVTEGMAAVKQKELIFTLGRNPAEKPEDYPREPLEFFKNVYQSAAQERVVNIGDFSELGVEGFLGRRDFRAVTYIKPESFKGVVSPSPLLAVIVLTGEEQDVARSFGLTRVLAMLGEAYRFYPCPPWLDRARNSLVTMKMVDEQSLLAKVRRSNTRGLSILSDKQKGTITLRVLTGARPQLQSLLARVSPTEPLALITGADPRANACLVWQPGQSQPTAIGPDGTDMSRMTANFALFVPGDEKNDSHLVEDGFGILLKVDAWSAIRQALESGKPLSIKNANGDPFFAIEWIEQSYQNPVDGKRYETEAGWEVYDPQLPAPRKKDAVVNVESIVLLTPENEMAERISVKALSGYIGQMEQIVEKHFKTAPRQSGQDLVVQCDLQPGSKAEYKLAMRPGMDEKLMKPLVEKLYGLSAPEIKETISFQIIFTLWGGSGEAVKIGKPR